MRSTTADWYEHIQAEHLSQPEKDGIALFQNYLRAIQQRVAATIDEETAALPFDIDVFRRRLGALVGREPKDAILAATSMADSLLKDMFRRETRARVEMDTLLGALGPLGDFNKRLKIAAIAEWIDDDCLAFFDELRKLRNQIAHSEEPSNPNSGQIERLIQASPVWLDVLEEPNSPVRGSKIERGSRNALIAALAVHLSLLAWQTILMPAARRANVPLKMLIDRRAKAFTDTSAIGMGIAISVLGLQRKN